MKARLISRTLDKILQDCNLYAKEIPRWHLIKQFNEKAN